MQYWIQPDDDTIIINNLQSEIGQITGNFIDYVNSPEGFLFYIKEIENNGWDWTIKSEDNKYFISISNDTDECYSESHNLTIALLTCYLDAIFQQDVIKEK